MSDIDDGGPAFPISEQIDRHGDTYMYADPGMTLRDYFAAKAMAAIISQMDFRDDEFLAKGSLAVSAGAYVFADSMLEARKK